MSVQLDTKQTAVIEKAMRQRGYRLTAARRIVVETLVACHAHISADDLYERVHQKAAAVGRMTVYRTLDLLSELGVIRPIYQGTGAAHYVLLHDGHHHHLVCSICHTVVEFDDCVVSAMAQEISQQYNFETQGHLVEFYGRCQNCQENNV